MAPIQFFFEFASPYSYIASMDIEAVAATAGRTVEYLPIEIASVWSTHGVLDAYTAIRRLKRPYIARDVERCAKLRGISMAKPSVSAIDATIAKLAYWGLCHDDPVLGKRFLQLVWQCYFRQGKPINELKDVANATQEIGLGEREIQAAAEWAGARQAQDESNAAAVRSGCFGVPWFVADGESFFGQDRLEHLAAYLASCADVRRR